jgi:rhodanese-related sulfurtransferase
MSKRIFSKRLLVFVVVFVTLLALEVNGNSSLRPVHEGQADANVQFVTVDELKAKLAQGEPIAIIDVRGSSDLQASDNKIKGAIYVRPRRLKSRLALPPLKDIPRDRQIVTYCACPNDEASIRAVQVLRESGFKRAYVLKGGWVAWKRANGVVEPFSKVM